MKRDRFTWLVYLLLAFYAYFLNVLGPITPFLKDELHLSYTASSLHFTAFAAGLLLIGLMGQTVIRRLGETRALWAGAIGISVSSLILVAGRSVLVTIAASFCMGLVGSLILATVPLVLSRHHGHLRSVAIAEANVAASLASTAAPLMVGLAARVPGGWRWALAVAALAPLMARPWLARSAARQSDSHSIDAAPADAATRQKRLPKLYWLLWSALLLGVSLEFCMISWSASYLISSLGMAKANAAQSLSLFLAGMLIGRVAGSRLLRRFSPHAVLMGSIGVASIGFALFWAASRIPEGLIGLFVTGLGIAGLYPLLLSLGIAVAPNSVEASARAALASGIAILALPLVLGRLADMVGLRPAYALVAVLLVAIFLIVLISQQKTHARPRSGRHFVE